MNVKMTFTFKGAPLCFWDVTIKNADVPLLLLVQVRQPLIQENKTLHLREL
jgi:hypothetical protein